MRKLPPSPFSNFWLFIGQLANQEEAVGLCSKARMTWFDDYATVYSGDSNLLVCRRSGLNHTRFTSAHPLSPPKGSWTNRQMNFSPGNETLAKTDILQKVRYSLVLICLVSDFFKFLTFLSSSNIKNFWHCPSKILPQSCSSQVADQECRMRLKVISK